MSSVGQAAGYLVGGVAGSIVPGVGTMLGAQIGGMIGGYIDPPKGARQVIGKLDDKSVQTASYGVDIPDVYGEDKLKGNVIWIKGNQMDESSTSSGGKGGSKPKTTTYTYSMTFAVAFSLGPIEAVTSIRVGTKQLFLASAADLDSIIAQNNSAAGWKIYYGTDDQMPDPAMAADVGATNCPAYRGIFYIVFYDLPMADYGNSPMGALVEVVAVRKATNSGTMTQVATWSWSQETSIALTDDIYETWGSNSAPSDATLHESGTQTATAVGQSGMPGAVAYDMSGAWNVIGTAPTARIWVENVEYAHFDNSSTPRQIVKMRRIDGAYYGIIREDPSLYPDHRHSLVRFEFGDAASVLTAEIRLDHGEFAFLGDVLGSVWIDPASGNTSVRVRLYDADFNLTETRTFTGTPPVTFWPQSLSNLSDWPNHSCWMSGRTLTIASGTPGLPAIVTYDMDSGAAVERSLGGTVSFAAPTALRVYPGGIVKMVGTASATPTYTHLWAPSPPTVGVQTLDEVVSHRSLKSRLTAADIDVTDLAGDIVRGYMASGGSLRGSIEPLQRIFPFDVRQNGYQLQFVRRPKASVLTIPESDLGASAEGLVARLTETIEMDGQLPRKVSIKYRDIGRGFDVNEQYDARLNTSSVNEVAIETTVVLTANEAAGAAQQTLYRGWVERSEYSFTVPDVGDYRKLQPADVVTVIAGSAAHEMLIREIETLPNLIREIKAIRNASSVFTPTAVGATGAYVAPTIAGASKTAGLILDIPAVSASQNVPSVLVAMRGGSLWPGGTLFVSRDAGASWTALVDCPSGKIATMGFTETALPDANTCAMVDPRGSVQLRITSGETLAGITRDELLNWGNLFAIGAPGRWELVQAQEVATVAADVYTLSRFLRGRFGTEWATATHQVGDSVVLLDTDLCVANLQSSDFDVNSLFKLVTHGQYLDTARSFESECTGVSLECLSPVNLKYHKTSDGDLVISATRRARHDGVWRNYADVPLNEENERYSGLIYEDATYTRVKRAFDGLTSCAFTYTAAQQLADFTVAPDPVYVEMCQVSTRRGRGYPVRKTIQFGDPYWPYVTIALHCDGLPGATALNDLTGRSWSHLGGTNTIDDTVFKFGGASAGGATASTGWVSSGNSGVELAAQDFSVSFWYDPDSSGGNSWPIYRGTLPSTRDWGVLMNSAGATPSFIYNTGGVEYSVSFGTIKSGWAYYEWCRVGGTDYAFIDGDLVGSQTNYGAVRATSGASTYFCGGDGTIQFVNHVDDFLLTVGVGRHTTSYTPPSAPFSGA